MQRVELLLDFVNKDNLQKITSLFGDKDNPFSLLKNITSDASGI